MGTRNHQSLSSVQNSSSLRFKKILLTHDKNNQSVKLQPCTPLIKKTITHQNTRKFTQTSNTASAKVFNSVVCNPLPIIIRTGQNVRPNAYYQQRFQSRGVKSIKTENEQTRSPQQNQSNMRSNNLPLIQRPQSSTLVNNKSTESPNNTNKSALSGNKAALSQFIVDSINQILVRLDHIEKQQEANNALLNQLTNNRFVTVTSLPDILPFKSISELLAFDQVDDDVYNEVVHYLVYLGGMNVTDSAARYLKNCFEVDENLLINLTWNGSKKNMQTSLGETRFARACLEALSLNQSILLKPNHEEFVWAMCKALKSMKERLRRKQERNKQQNEYETEEPRKRIFIYRNHTKSEQDDKNHYDEGEPNDTHIEYVDGVNEEEICNDNTNQDWNNDTNVDTNVDTKMEQDFRNEEDPFNEENVNKLDQIDDDMFEETDECQFVKL